MLSRFLLSTFLVIAAVAAAVMVAYKGNWGCSQRQVLPEKRYSTGAVREHKFPEGRMLAACPVSKVVRHPSVPLPNVSRAELRRLAPAGSSREQEARRLASEKNQVMDELLAGEPKRPAELRAALGISSANFFTSRYLTPLADAGYISVVGGENLHSPQRKYRLLVKGKRVVS